MGGGASRSNHAPYFCCRQGRGCGYLRSVSTLKDDLKANYAELRETHISWVFLDDHDVYKIKKPVSFGFLDFTTLARRKAACEAEVELNRRLAKDVYLGVRPVRVSADGRHYVDPGVAEEGLVEPHSADDEIVDWAVHMRRVSDGDRADHRLAAQRLTPSDIDRVAVHLVDFHANAASDAQTASFGKPDNIAINVRENFAQTRAYLTDHLRPEEADEIEQWQLDFLVDKRERFLARMEAGRVRDGHGDLRLEHVYLEGETVTVLDCIEFNQRFRFADVCSDVAFLSMDLSFHGRVDLAERLLAVYAREADDYELYSVVDFYESYRAFVRGKIASMVAHDPELDPQTARRAAHDARAYFRLALAAERQPIVPPTLIAVGGIIASGKSTVSDRLSIHMGAPVVSTDRVRKSLLGVRPTDTLESPEWSGPYDPALTAEVYAKVFEHAKVILGSGRPVIVDATFRSSEIRAAARRVAQQLGAPFRFVECRVKREVARARAAKRDLSRSVSDGRPEVFDAFMARWEPPSELRPGERLVLDTEVPLEHNLAWLATQLPAWPPAPTA